MDTTNSPIRRFSESALRAKIKRESPNTKNPTHSTRHFFKPWNKDSPTAVAYLSVLTAPYSSTIRQKPFKRFLYKERRERNRSIECRDAPFSLRPRTPNGPI